MFRVNCLSYPNGPAGDNHQIHKWVNNNCKKTTLMSICKKKIGQSGKQQEDTQKIVTNYRYMIYDLTSINSFFFLAGLLAPLLLQIEMHIKPII